MNLGKYTRRDLQGNIVEQREIRLGDAVARIATPIARKLKLGCIDPKTHDLKPTSRCAKWKRRLNKIGKKSVAARIETE